MKHVGKVYGKKFGREISALKRSHSRSTRELPCASELSAGWIDGAMGWGLRILRRFEIPRE